MQVFPESIRSFVSVKDFSVSRLPDVIRIEPAGACNLQCTHCPTGLGLSKSTGIMSTDTFDNIVKALQSIPVRVVVLYHGGEPFLNKDLSLWINRLKIFGIPFVKTVTNGMMLRDAILASIIESGLDAIEFSLDGQSPEENNIIRVGGDYAQIVRTIKALVCLKEQLKSATPDIFVCNTQFVPEGISSSILCQNPITPQFLLEEFSGKYEGKVSFKNTFAIAWPGLQERIHGQFLETVDAETTTILPYCPQPLEILTIRWNGDIVPCCYDVASNYIVENISNASLEELWNNKRMRDLRKSLYYGTYLPLCQHCHVVKPSLFLGKKDKD